jgi:hypothetical protein
MSDELTHNFHPGETLYACRFQKNGDVFRSHPGIDEVWGSYGHTADDYDVPMVEEDNCGHYKGDFAHGGSIPAGSYYVTIYHQLTAIPLTGDPAIAQGVIYWDGTEEIDDWTINVDIEAGNANCQAPRQRAIIMKYLQERDGIKTKGPGASDG